MADSMPAPAVPPAKSKRPAAAAFGREEDLPHPRRLCFKRRLQLDIEERFREMILGAIPEVNMDVLSGSSPIGMVVVMGRVVGEENHDRDVILPTATEVILDDGHDFLPDLSLELFRDFRIQLERRLQAHKVQKEEDRRWAHVSLQQRELTSTTFKSLATFYSPASRWHYQLRFRAVDPEGVVEETQRRETNLVFQKVSGSDDPSWTISLVQERGKTWVELRMNEAFLLNHLALLRNAKPHCFNRLCRDFRRNAQAVQQLLDRMEPLEGDGVKRLYYPGVFDGAVRVQEYYGKRARYQHAADEGQLEVTARIRRFNNCVKTMMIESFMDGMKGNLRILDLACGRGQDILKYSREHRLCTVQHVMGIDFAAEAVEEAKRRYSTLCSKAQASGRPEFLADFRCGDLRKASTLEDVVREGRSFDVVLCQLALHYLLSSEEAATRFLQHLVKLLRPGGRFIATVPSCEVLADFYEKASFVGNRTTERVLRHKLFRVSFEGTAWQQLQYAGVQLELDEVFLRRWGLPYLFSLEGAVHGEEYILPWEAFEELANSFGLRVLADASFPDLYDQLKPRSRFYNNFFCKDDGNAQLDGDEEILFKLYQGFVMEKPLEGAKESQEEKISAAWSGRARPGPPLPGLRALSGGNPSRTSATREKAAGAMSAQGLPAHILALFTPRPPPQHLPPCVLKPSVKLSGCAEYVEFFSADPPPPKEPWESPLERKARRHREKVEAHKAAQKKIIEAYDPHKDPNASGDPFKTLFVGRISYDTTEKKLKREFEVFGSIKKVRMVYDQKGKPRGYAFIEFEHERDLKNAYKQGDGKKIDGRRVMVDVERGRTVEGWLPRRLGGGRGPGRQGKPAKKKQRRLAETVEKAKEKEKEEKAEKKKDKEKEKEKEKEKDKGKERDKEEDRKERRDRDKEKEKSREKEKDKEKDREKEKEKEKDRDREKDRDKEKKDKDKERKRERSRSRDRDRRK